MSNETEFFSGYAIEHEKRDVLIATAKPVPANLMQSFNAPPEIDPRLWHKIEMQGSMGACQGHALSSVVEMAWFIVMGTAKQFSRLFGYYATQKLDGLLGRDVGSTIEGGCRLAKEYGLPPEEVMPYPVPARYTGRIPQAAWDAASPFRIRSHAVCNSYDDVFTYLASGQGGVEIGIAWGSMTPVNGVIENYTPGRGGHAVCFLGYSRRRDADGRQYLWMANSWDEQWGNRGWAEVAPRAVDAMCRHQYTVMIGMSDLTTPKPRLIDLSKINVMA